MKEYRLDKTQFKMQTFKEAGMANICGEDVPYAERFRRAYYLISLAYRFSRYNPPKLDRTFFSSRKRQ
jgi:hypothetical protein